MYDGVCGLCNRFVQFVLQRDPSARFSFAALQSDIARDVLTRHSRRTDVLETLYLIRDFEGQSERVLSRSDAALAIVGELQGPIRILALGRAIPRFVRDAVYGFVARHRYRVWGELSSCPRPTPQTKSRFLA